MIDAQSLQIIIGGIGILVIYLIVSVIIIVSTYKEDLKKLQKHLFRNGRRRGSALPDDNGIYNISSRVQGQQSQYPDAYLSVDHITISNELNKPPKYDDAPPSYEEAVKLAMAHSNSIQTFQAEQVNNTRPQAHSSTTTTVVVPAVAGQSTE
ncbi:uncharacterized protein [Euwallacea similis]|uniref:uncharacterized protein isoform X5 n=1 Tax=Euwallacea similis TaxID=1736056 RepID=UPI0034504126